MTSHLDELFEGLPKKLDAPQTAEILGVTKKRVYQWIHQGVIPAYKIGSTWIILRDELRDTIASGSNLTDSKIPPQVDAENTTEKDTDPCHP